MDKTFRDYQKDGASWITLSSGEFYPDILLDACKLFKPVLETFARIIITSESSERLFLEINNLTSPWMRIQLLRVFKKYVSPDTPVEMLKIKKKTSWICKNFKSKFRPINEVQKAFVSRPMPDEALCAILWEYKDRGKKGYDLTERMFELLRSTLPSCIVEGPERAGRDILLGDIFPDYPYPKRPADFVIKENSTILAVGFARYDSDRGGSQEDDRTGGYNYVSREVLEYAIGKDLRTKVIFVNDGPGLLLGSMWDDYSHLEEKSDDIMVVTSRMIPERIKLKWLKH